MVYSQLISHNIYSASDFKQDVGSSIEGRLHRTVSLTSFQSASIAPDSYIDQAYSMSLKIPNLMGML